MAPNRTTNQSSRHRGRRGLLFITAALVLLYFALSPPPNVFAVNPTPDGGYANGNTAEGTDALFSLTTGTDNTAIGNLALHTTTNGIGNTGIGVDDW